MRFTGPNMAALVGVVWLVVGPSVYVIGCSGTELPRGAIAFDAAPSNKPPTGPSSGDPVPGNEEDAFVQQDASDADPNSACLGKANGTLLATGAPRNRCCAQAVVDLHTTDNCGGCGIKCPAGMACEQPILGQWNCRCNSNVGCVTSGYGPEATCYTPTVGAKAFCNCQCPSGMDGGSCANTCAGGATCRELSGHNACSYPDGGS